MALISGGYSHVMKNNLAPVTVTDKNGRVTTVHKRLEGRQSASNPLKVPAPALTTQKPTSEQPRTLLAPVEMMTADEAKLFSEWHETMLEKSHYNDRAKAACRKPLEPEICSLAWNAVNSGVSKAVVMSLINEHQITNHMFRQLDNPVTLLQGQLRMAERIAQLDPEMASSPALTTTIEHAVNGYNYSSKQELRVSITSIDTQEELDSITAVTMFVFNAVRNEHSDQYRQSEFKDSEGRQVMGSRIVNRSLDTFLRQNPHEVNKVISYANSRRLGATVKDTAALVQYLKDNEAPALNEGWL